jgi:hypothetical protein
VALQPGEALHALVANDQEAHGSVSLLVAGGAARKTRGKRRGRQAADIVTAAPSTHAALPGRPCNEPASRRIVAVPMGMSLSAHGIRVGLVWAAGDRDPRRSVPTAALAPLANLPGIELHLLQRGAARDAWTFPGAVDAGCDSIVDLAEHLGWLDLLISFDSFPGVATWTLLHADADWRWMDGRSDSPWYPTMRLFRQPRPGDWHAVVAAVAEALRPGPRWVARREELPARG